MNNIMKLADEYALRRQKTAIFTESTQQARAELEAAVNQQAAEIERLKDALDCDRAILKARTESRDALQAKLSAMEAVEPQPPFGSKRKAAMAVYRPPFKYEHGYVYDSQNLMVADDGDIADEKLSVTGAVASRVRGWGRLSYLPNGAELQDEIGQMMADALNALFTAPKVAQQPLTDEQIEAGRKATFSTDNPYCPCTSKTMLKAVWWAERKHGIGGQQL